MSGDGGYLWNSRQGGETSAKSSHWGNTMSWRREEMEVAGRIPLGGKMLETFSAVGEVGTLGACAVRRGGAAARTELGGGLKRRGSTPCLGSVSRMFFFGRDCNHPFPIQ